MKETTKLSRGQVLGIGQFLVSKETPITPKIAVVLAIAYLLFPIDLVPDAIPVLGVMDDVGLGMLATWWLSSAMRQFNQRGDDS